MTNANADPTSTRPPLAITYRPPPGYFLLRRNFSRASKPSLLEGLLPTFAKRGARQHQQAMAFAQFIAVCSSVKA
jgi:hypothetical protein